MTSAPSGPKAAVGTWSSLLAGLLQGKDISDEQAAWAMGEIISGEASSAQISAFAVLLRAKGETPHEVGGLVQAMLDHATRISIPGPALDIVGTGGDSAHTVNISTMAALVAAGAGTPVVKHGNRAASSLCGTADVLEALGVVIDLPGPAVARCVEEAGIGFCFAPIYHPGLKHAAIPRREIGVPTTFNFLGPLANPAAPSAQAIGCSDLRMAPIMASVLARRGVTALVFRGDDGLDELTTTTTSQIWIVQRGAVTHSTVDIGEVGLPAASIQDLEGGEPSYNARVARSVLGGERGHIRDAVILNTAAGLATFDGLQTPLIDALRAGMDRAARSIDSGAAVQVLDQWISVSRVEDATRSAQNQ